MTTWHALDDVVAPLCGRWPDSGPARLTPVADRVTCHACAAILAQEAANTRWAARWARRRTLIRRLWPRRTPEVPTSC